MLYYNLGINFIQLNSYQKLRVDKNNLIIDKGRVCINTNSSFANTLLIF